LPREPAGGPLPWLQDAVEHDGPYPLREEVGVHLTHVRPVGGVDVGQLWVADGAAEQVQVPGHIGGEDVRRQRPGVLRAACGDLADLPDRRGLFGFGEGEDRV
jgi:hypothetical protein